MVILPNITKRKQAEGVIRERLHFEELLSNLSVRFVNIPPDQVGPEIERGLKQILASSRLTAAD